MEQNGYTPTQQRILAVLADGKPHSLQELHGCLNDELSQEDNLRSHVNYLKRRLKPSGQGILCEKGAYRLVRFLDNPYRG